MASLRLQAEARMAMVDPVEHAPQSARVASRSAAFREPVALALLLIAVVALHAGALGKPFFADDYFFLEQVRGRSLPEALAAPDPLGNFLRPVSRQLHFWSLARLGNESPL